MTTTTTAADRVRAWARGLYPLEAGAELLIRAHRVYDGAPWVVDTDNPDRAYIDTEKLLYESGAWSGREQRLVRIAASLLDSDHTVDLHEDVSGLDRANLTLVLAAIAHAGGSHQHSGIERNSDGTSSVLLLDTLFPWPQG